MSNNSPQIPLVLFLSAFALLTSSSLSQENPFAGHGYSLISSKVNNIAGDLLIAELELIRNSSIYGPDINKLSFKASFETKDRLRVRITDSHQPRWEVPEEVMPRRKLPEAVTTTESRTLSLAGSDLTLAITSSSPFEFTIIRQSTGDVLFSTAGGPLVFKDRYLEIASVLPGDKANIYGLGEHTTASFRRVSGEKLTLWNSGSGSVNPNINLYGSHPFYMDVRSPAGTSHGVLLLNSNGMDVKYEGTHITYKVIGGVLDFYFFAGPTPAAVVDQYTELIGRPAPMPYWSFGFHQCRYGYKNYKELEEVVAGYADAEIPLSVMWTDIEYMDGYKDFTLDPINYPADKMTNFVQKLHDNGQKYVVIVDPGISANGTYETFQRGLKDDIFIKWNGTNYLGAVWPGPVYFPDFLNPITSKFWSQEISLFHKTLSFDGLWIDMNEITNFVNSAPLTEVDTPPYKINNDGVEKPLGNNTLPASCLHYGDLTEYDVHNLYGYLESRATNEALIKDIGKRPFVLSRSTFVGSGKYTAHWTGDNGAMWEDLAYSIPTILNFGLFGIPMVGADICGFFGNTTEELCNRWIQVGAFYPFARDHSEKSTARQELYLWKSVTKSAKKALGLRYRLLPYYYTQMYYAHQKGTPIARPLFFSFPDDLNTYAINTQFLIGDAVLVSPVLQPGATELEAYFPIGSWFNLFNISSTVKATFGQKVTLQASSDTINVHARGGSIFLMQDSVAVTQLNDRKLEILVVLNEEGISSGEVFFDDGEVVEMAGNVNEWALVRLTCKTLGRTVTLKSDVVNGTYSTKNILINKVTFLGLKPTLGNGMLTYTLVQPKFESGVGGKANYEVGGEFGHAEVNGISQSIEDTFELNLFL